MILAELYESDGPAFVEQLILFTGSFKPLLGVIERWKKDKSAPARKLKISFVLDERLQASHRPVFKRLFKQAWHDRDMELMAAFLVRLDRSIRRRKLTRHRRENRVLITEQVLRVSPRDRTTIFSSATTHYLRRRAWRFFRKMGLKDPAAYVPAISRALVRYVDDDVRLGQNLLDNWGLMHACFGKSAVLTFNARHTNLATSARLSEMEAAPMFEKLWALPEAANSLLSILLDANCRAVRVWTIQLLKRHHIAALASIDAAMLLRLISHADADVATFAAELLGNARMVGALPMTTWLQLLATRNPAVVAAIALAFEKHVNFDRVTLPQAVEIANNVATPVARLGFEILKTRTIRDDAARAEISRLADARCSAMGGDIARFAMSLLNVAGVYQAARVIAFFDSSLASVRDGAFAALEDPSPAGIDPAFWAALFESPYDDVRLQLIDRLNRRQSLPGAGADALANVWQTVLLNIHRGGRAKLSALKQISRQIMLEPQSAALLLPVLAVAIRSVRGPEARHGLAAIVAAVERLPALVDDVAKYLPEIQFDLAGASR